MDSYEAVCSSLQDVTLHFNTPCVSPPCLTHIYRSLYFNHSIPSSSVSTSASSSSLSRLSFSDYCCRPSGVFCSFYSTCPFPFLGECKFYNISHPCSSPAFSPQYDAFLKVHDCKLTLVTLHLTRAGIFYVIMLPIFYFHPLLLECLMEFLTLVLYLFLSLLSSLCAEFAFYERL